ncbi:MAG: phosphotransferase family protein [Thermomicrobiales bacterium]
MVNTAGVEAFLVSRFGPEVKHVAGVGQGEWSKAYAFQHRGSHFVARFGAFEEDFAKDRLAARFGSRDLPIPKVTDTRHAFGGFYAVSERAFGEYIDVLDQARMRAVLPSLFATLDAPGRVDLSATRGYGGWGADGTAPYASWRAALLGVATDHTAGRTRGWRERLAASPVGRGPFEEAFGHLQALVDHRPEQCHFIHSDMLNYNVLVQEGRISAVFDWGRAKYGDFLYDLAWFAFWAPWYPAWQRIDFRDEARRHFEEIGLDVPSFEERFRCCQIHIGLDGQAYTAFKRHWLALADVAQRTLAVAIGRIYLR